MDTTQPHKTISEIFSEMMSSPHPSLERINTFMNTVYLHHPRTVTPYILHYRTPTARSSIKGIRVGMKMKRSQPQKSIVLVSGLPLQDSSVISVNLYVAAMLSRMVPMVPFDVSVIPLAHPKEYEKRWRRMELATSPHLSSRDMFREELPLPLTENEESNSFPRIIPETSMCFELGDTCKPLETYITRQSKYYINIDVDLNANGSTMQYKSNSLPNLAAKGKHADFLAHTQSLDGGFASLTPPILDFPLLAPMLQSPSIVLELRSSQALDDDQIVRRGEEIIAMVKKLLV